MTEFLNFISSPKIIISLIVCILAFLMWLAIRKAHKRYISAEKAKGEKSTLIRVTFGMLQSLIVAGAMLLTLQINGINVTSAVAGLGLLSAIVGLALQDVLKDSIMGVNIMSDHFYSVGDVVKYKEIEGVVIGFTMKTTTLRNIYDQTITTICNRNISEITKMPQSSQVDIDIPFSYDEDYKNVNDVLENICEQISRLEGIDSCVYKGIQRFADSAVIYKIRLLCLPETKPEITRAALRVIQHSLDERNLHIPYNGLDVYGIIK